MNAKEAMEVIKRAEQYDPKLPIAHGFIEAVEKFNPVVEVLDVFVEVGYDRSKAVKILRYYRREVLGEE